MTAVKPGNTPTKSAKRINTANKRKPTKNNSSRTTSTADLNANNGTTSNNLPSSTLNINSNNGSNFYNSNNNNLIDDMNDGGDEVGIIYDNKSSNYLDPPRDKNRYKYRIEIQQMMFVSGEVNEPPERTTDLIEDIVRDQVVALLLQAQRTTQSRGQKSILPEDLIFLIRHDKAKVNRLRTYLSWKDVRKNAKDQESGEIGAATGGGATDLLEEVATVNNVDNKSLTKQKKALKLPWELEFMFSEQPLTMGNGDDDQIDEEERDAVLAQIKRLKQNDERTKHMTQQEYVHWSDCRQASFTFRKSKRFREWCGISHVTESRPNDDVIDILGFLTFETVCSITEEALIVKQCMDKNCDERDGSFKKNRYLFMEPSNNNKPINVEHVQEAWRRLQTIPNNKKALFNFRGGRMKRSVRLI